MVLTGRTPAKLVVHMGGSLSPQWDTRDAPGPCGTGLDSTWGGGVLEMLEELELKRHG